MSRFQRQFRRHWFASISSSTSSSPVSSMIRDNVNGTSSKETIAAAAATMAVVCSTFWILSSPTSISTSTSTSTSTSASYFPSNTTFGDNCYRSPNNFHATTSLQTHTTMAEAALPPPPSSGKGRHQDEVLSSLASPLEANKKSKTTIGPKLIFLGTGSSTGCPKPLCTLLTNKLNSLLATKRKSMDGNVVVDDDEIQAIQEKLDQMCRVSQIALMSDAKKNSADDDIVDDANPRLNKNYRNNPSFLIHHLYDGEEKSDGPSPPTYKNIIIDVGKTFREGALRWFPTFQIASLDAIVLTHHHMDAAGGLDDVRGFQQIILGNSNSNSNDITSSPPTQTQQRKPIPLYLSPLCQKHLQFQFPWLLPSKTAQPPALSNSKAVVKRDVASFDVNVFEDYRPMNVHGIEIVPLPVWHGDDLISHGFAFSVPTSDFDNDDGDVDEDEGNEEKEKKKKMINVVYLSDISRMVPATLDYINNELPPTDVFIIDSLLWHKDHPVHYSLDQAVALSRQIHPKNNKSKRTYLIGMSCDAFLPHDEMNEYLSRKYGDDETGTIQFAHDGLVINL